MAILLIISISLFCLSVLGWVVILKIATLLRVNTFIRVKDNDNKTYVGYIIINQLTSYKQGKVVIFSLKTLRGEVLLPSGCIKEIKVLR